MGADHGSLAAPPNSPAAVDKPPPTARPTDHILIRWYLYMVVVILSGGLGDSQQGVWRELRELRELWRPSFLGSPAESVGD
jgi:hypothetical protein